MTAPRISRLALRALSAALVAGCSSADGATNAPGLTPDPAATGSTVYLRGRADGDQLAVDVFARGTADVHGVALRLAYAPAVLALVDATPAPAWAAGSVALAREGTPGETAITWAIRGSTRGFAAKDETLLGTVRFHVKGRAESPLAIRAERSRVIDSSGKALPVVYRGGRLAAR